MRARADRMTYKTAAVNIAMSLEEAFAMGTVLAGIEGEDAVSRRVRTFGEGLLMAGRTVLAGEVREIAVALAGASASTRAGKIARSLADGLAEVATEAEKTAKVVGYGHWREIGSANGRDGARMEKGNAE